jgi:predicted TIM-barrel fold metal-dependent hydrolase
MTTAIKFGAIDADAHVVETEQTWEYMDPGDRKYRPKLFGSDDDPSTKQWVIDGRMCGLRLRTLSEMQLRAMSDRIGRDFMSTPEAKGMDDVSLRLRHMDELGIDVQVLHNTIWIREITQRPEIDVALTTSWNRWMADVWRQGDGRLVWASVLPLTDLDTAVGMMDLAQQNGAVAVVMKPFEGNRFMLDPYFHPYYEAAERRGLAIAIHIANASPQLTSSITTPYDPSGGFSTFRMPTVLGCHGLLLSKLPRMFPNLRWGFVESSAQWIPWVLHEVRRRALQNGQDLPENPFKAYNVYVSSQTDDDFGYIFDNIGDDNVVIGTDYGHVDTSSEYDAIETFRRLPSVADASKRKVLLDNAAALYGLG